MEVSGLNRNRILRLLCMFSLLAVMMGIAVSCKQQAAKAGATERPMQQNSERPLLVNPWNSLPETHSVELVSLGNGHAIAKEAYPHLMDLLDAAEEEGLSPIICSSYRSYETQQELFSNKVAQYLALGYSQADAEREAGKWVARPGTSEHQTGLAVDLVALDYQLLDENQETTAEQIWLMANAHHYGFILRYPQDKSVITGIYYEPWHYRYVGTALAKELHEKGLCLEEYLQKNQ